LPSPATATTFELRMSYPEPSALRTKSPTAGTSPT
jgi:hypothetical protein